MTGSSARFYRLVSDRGRDGVELHYNEEPSRRVFHAIEPLRRHIEERRAGGADTTEEEHALMALIDSFSRNM